MNIHFSKALNHSVDQYKLLSSNAGVGAIINTRLGFSIMPLSIENWKFIQRVDKKLLQNPNLTIEEIEEKAAVEVIEDERFLQYLKRSEGLPSLSCLVAIPHMQINERYNTVDVKNNPLFKKYLEPNDYSPSNCEDWFVVPGIVFPRWMVSQKTNFLHSYDYWKEQWKTRFRRLNTFAPPRDASSPTGRTYTSDGEERKEYALLTQMPFVLICPNGHVSDIPWDKFFSARLKDGPSIYRRGYNLFGFSDCDCEKGGKHEIFYSENKNHSEGFGVLKCDKCKEVVSLEGIMNLRPKCSREKPWIGKETGGFEKDKECKVRGKDEDETMRVALVSSNSVYYAEAFSSLYIPKESLSFSSPFELSNLEQKAYEWLCNNAYKHYSEENPGKLRIEYWEESYHHNGDFIDELEFAADIHLSEKEANNVKKRFLDDDNTKSKDGGDKVEEYRFQEYAAFTKQDSLSHPKLCFHNIEMPKSLSPFFSQISQVDTVCVTKAQTNFYRVSIQQPVKTDNGIKYPDGCKIYGANSYKVRVLPANQVYGEGLFFELNKEYLDTWSQAYSEKYRYRDTKFGSQVSMVLDTYGAPAFYVLHTLAHLIIKELEFSCGYPSASLTERIYYSKRMCGLLIYTTDGAEGGMGGLVWQGQPELIERIITKALTRALNCSSDPVCWEHDESLNYAACFSCCMISETSCEYRNMGLDRRALVDTEYGFFKSLL